METKKKKKEKIPFGGLAAIHKKHREEWMDRRTDEHK
jgi:hypothetical protein